MGKRQRFIKLFPCLLNNINEDVVLKAGIMNDAIVKRVVSEFAGYICLLLYNLILVFDPNVIILGGNILKFKSLISDDISAGFRQINQRLSKNVILDFSHFKENSSIKGACKAALLNSLLNYNQEGKDEK